MDASKDMRLTLQIFKPSLLFLLLWICTPVLANANPPFLWKVQYRQATLYLAGSIHALTHEDYPLPEAYQRAFTQSDQLAVELNVNTLNPARTQALVQSRSWLPKGRNLSDFLSKPALARLQQFSKDAGVPYQRLLQMRPWLVIEQLTGQQLDQSDYLPELGVDQYFLQQAAREQKPILELETLEQQISAMADSPFASQIAALELSLQQMDDKDYMEKMTNFWRAADPDGLFHFVYQDVEQHPELKPMMEHLLDRRNQRMADILEIYLSQPRTTFVVVGALHLSGPNSLIKMLENKGYSPYKVTNSTELQPSKRPVFNPQFIGEP